MVKPKFKKTIKYIKKVFLIIISLIIFSLLSIIIFQYELVKRIVNRGESYTYSDVVTCKKEDSNSISSKDLQYKNVIEKARDSVLYLKDKYNIPGLAICVIANNKIIWNEGFGCEDFKNNQPITVVTRFRVGSISKSMTGIALMKLYQENRLDFSKTIDYYLPTFPNKKYPIHINELASHQSGIRHYKGVEMLSNKPFEFIEESLSVFKDASLLFEPGTNYKYSTYNYVLLSRIIEKITKSTYLDYMKKEVFEPLGMNLTIPDRKSLNTIGYSSGTNSKIKHAIEVNVSNKWAGGGYLSTPKDLAIMLNNLDSVLTKDSQKTLFNPQNFKNGKPTGTDYAYGFRKTTLSGDTEINLIHHGGSSVGGRAFLLKLVEDNIIVAICANSDTGLLMPNNYGLQEMYDIAKCFKLKN
jgi:CubicO group peptidase (beta-lactamase class C family)